MSQAVRKIPSAPTDLVLQEPAASPTIEEIVELFLLSQDVRPASRSLYGTTLRLFLGWVDKNGHELKGITRTEILRYREDLLQAGLSTLSVGSYLTSVRRFYEWVEAHRYGPNVARGVKNPKQKQQFRKQPLSPTQGKALLAHFGGKGNGQRDFAIVNLLLRTGLRTIELVRAIVEDITWKGDRRVLLVHGKGRDEKDSFVILTDKSYGPIKAYLESRGKVNGKEPLFACASNNNRGRQLTTRSIRGIAKEGLRAIGLDDRSLTAHSLRHSTAVNILRAGGSLEAAQHVLRHSNPATTQIYTATIKEEMRLKNAAESLLDELL